MEVLADENKKPSLSSGKEIIAHTGPCEDAEICILMVDEISDTPQWIGIWQPT